jgi:Flp pilus assembly protein TadD
MKTTIITALLIFLASCASDKGRINKESTGTLASESFQSLGKNRVAELDSNDKVLWQCYQGKVKESLDEYKKMYESRKNFPEYWLHLANCYLSSGDKRKAEFYYLTAIAESKSKRLTAMANNNLALIYASENHADKASLYFSRSIEADSSLQVPKFNHSQLLIQFGQYKRAIQILHGLVKEGANDAEVNFALGSAYLFSGDLESASPYLDKTPSSISRRKLQQL